MGVGKGKAGIKLKKKDKEKKKGGYSANLTDSDDSDSGSKEITVQSNDSDVSSLTQFKHISDFLNHCILKDAGEGPSGTHWTQKKASPKKSGQRTPKGSGKKSDRRKTKSSGGRSPQRQEEEEEVISRTGFT